MLKQQQNILTVMVSYGLSRLGLFLFRYSLVQLNRVARFFAHAHI